MTKKLGSEAAGKLRPGLTSASSPLEPRLQRPASLIRSGTSEFEDFIFLVAQCLGPRRPGEGHRA